MKFFLIFGAILAGLGIISVVKTNAAVSTPKSPGSPVPASRPKSQLVKGGGLFPGFSCEHAAPPLGCSYRANPTASDPCNADLICQPTENLLGRAIVDLPQPVIPADFRSLAERYSISRRNL